MEKYLVVSSGDTLDSTLSGRFGHSGCFLLIDPLTMEFEAIKGVRKDEDQDIGKFITQAEKKVITGNTGPSTYNEVLSYGCSTGKGLGSGPRDGSGKGIGGGMGRGISVGTGRGRGGRGK